MVNYCGVTRLDILDKLYSRNLIDIVGKITNITIEKTSTLGSVGPSRV